MTEAENGFGGKIYCRGHGTEQTFNFGGSVVATERPSPPRWTRSLIKFEVWRKRDGTLSCPVPFHMNPKREEHVVNDIVS